MSFSNILQLQKDYREFIRWVREHPGQKPASGQRFGEHVYNPDAHGLIDPANPMDPNQTGQWIAEQPGLPDYFSVLSPSNMATAQNLLSPIFAQQTQMLNRQQANSLADARRSAGAYAASRGYSNPMSLLSRAASGVREQYAPQYEALRTAQMQAPLGLLNQQYQSQVGQRQFDLSKLQGQQSAGFQERAYQDATSFDFFRDLMPGLTQGGFSLVSGGLMPGGWLNTPMF